MLEVTLRPRNPRAAGEVGTHFPRGLPLVWTVKVKVCLEVHTCPSTLTISNECLGFSHTRPRSKSDDQRKKIWLQFAGCRFEHCDIRCNIATRKEPEFT